LFSLSSYFSSHSYFSFVTRAGNPKDNKNHSIVTIQEFEPRDFATQINLNPKNSWEILKYILTVLQPQPAGKYVLMRDTERPCLRLFEVPKEGAAATAAAATNKE
jgi:translation initiation factor 3 subunit D